MRSNLLQFGWSLFLAFGLLTPLAAQQELGTHFLRQHWQASLTNPAFMTEHTIEIGLPSFYFNSATNGLDFDQLVRTTVEGQNVVNGEALIANQSENNLILADFHTETFRLGLRFQDLQISFHHGLRFNAYLNYPASLAQFIFLGNASAVGETLALGPDIQLTGYNEFALGLAHRVGRLGIGARAKLLTGIGNASTENRRADLFTDEDIYQLTLDTDILLNTSSYFRINSLTDFDLQVGVDDFTAGDLFSSNLGFALDFGLTYDLSDRWQIAASVVDLGGIQWSENVVNYRSNTNLAYGGIAVDSLLQSASIPLSETLDSLGELLTFSETTDNYQTALPLKVYLSSRYQFGDSWAVGGLVHLVHFRETTNWALSLNAQRRLGKVLSLGLSYSIRHDQFANLGLQAAAQLGPIGLLVMMDNVLASNSSNNGQNFNLRTGLNLAF
ncbi:MAG: DUF5723 family protein [Bacteroidota bacterium]